MRDVKRVALIACVVLVALRISIGWQLLYEGLWKIKSLETAKPWSSKGYLTNAQGPFRNIFRKMAGDPDDLDWLDYDQVAKRWDNWKESYIAHYSKLNDDQKLSDDQNQQLDLLLNGQEEFTETLKALPEGYTFPASLTKKTDYWGKTRQVIRYDAENQQLVLDGKLLLLPNERNALLKSSRSKEFQRAVKRLYDLSSRSAKKTYKIRLRGLLKGDPERTGLVYLDKEENKVVLDRIGETELYRESLKRYEKYSANAKTDFQQEHLKKIQSDLRAMRSRLVGPIKSLELELQQEANYKLKSQKTPPILNSEQIAHGPSPMPREKIDGINKLTIAALTGLGFLLIAGFFTRFAAIAGAGMLLSFYLVTPPWPGLPELPGPEHSFIVNKNFIEAMALLAIAALPTGTWFGVDGLFRRSSPINPAGPVAQATIPTQKPEVRPEDAEAIFQEALGQIKSESRYEIGSTS